MKERNMKFEKGPFPKKYTAYIKHRITGKTRKIHFGDRRYPQYKDRTPLKLYAKNNHLTRKRMQNYYSRHSGEKNRKKAIQKEKRTSPRSTRNHCCTKLRSLACDEIKRI